jgi:DNA-binding transcriptional ArsR family regulator
MDTPTLVAKLKVLSDERRLTILRTVRGFDCPLPVTLIARSANESIQVTSRILAALNEVGLVTRLRAGREVIYSADRMALEVLLKTLNSILIGDLE